MRIAQALILTMAAAAGAHADFSYTMTQKSGPGGNQTMKHYLKGQKMKVERGGTATIMDFESQTLTSINDAKKTYTVTKFSDLAVPAAEADIKADVKKTGQTKTINGYKAEEVVLTMDIAMPQGKSDMKAQTEMELWVSRDVPGREELSSFYRKNASRFPMALGGGGNPGMQKAMVALQRQMATIDGVPVMQVVRVKSAGGGPSGAQAAQMAQAKAKLEAMAQQGGPAGAAAQQALARMGGMGSASGGALFEITMEGSNYSTGSIPDSIFAIPAGYQKTDP